MQELLTICLSHAGGGTAERAYGAKLLQDFAAPGPLTTAQVMPNDEPFEMIEPLSEREMEVLLLICGGYSNKQIAGQLSISLNTVKKHTSHIYGKLQVNGRTQAIARARALHLVK